MRKLVFFFFLTAITSHAFASCCIVLNSPTATSGATYLNCQTYLSQTICDGKPDCKWDPVQYFQNNCSGQSIFNNNCPAGSNEIAFNPGTDINSKFKCCQPSISPANKKTINRIN